MGQSGRGCTELWTIYLYLIIRVTKKIEPTPLETRHTKIC